MRHYQRDFIEYSLANRILRFGEFELKSGRVSPYFFNSGLFNTGASLAKLGAWYAEAVIASGVGFDMIYGPAYKGIPLAAALSMTLAERHGRDVPYCFNRKEAKDHGEGGITIGATLEGRVLIVDDVISAGTSSRESAQLIRAAGAQPVAVAISLDRQERGAGVLSAAQEVERTLGLQVVSIASLSDLLAFLTQHREFSDHAGRVREYRERYGV